MEERMYPVRFMAVCLQDSIQDFVKLCDLIGNEIGKRSALRLLPDVFHRVKIGSVAREPIDAQPISAAVVQLPHGRTMRAQAVANQNHGTAQVVVHLAQKRDHIFRMYVMIEQRVIQAKPTGPRCATNRRQRTDPVVAIPSMLDGRITLRGPHSSSQRLQQIAAFIEKNQASLPFEALFLAAANPRGANGRWLARPARGLVVPVSAESTPASEADEGHSWDDSRRRRVGGSCRAPAARSIRRERSPNAACLGARRPQVGIVVSPTTGHPDRDVVSHAASRRDATLSSNARRTKRLSLPPQLLPSTTFPSQKAELRFVDELPAIRGFLLVS